VLNKERTPEAPADLLPISCDPVGLGARSYVFTVAPCERRNIRRFPQESDRESRYRLLPQPGGFEGHVLVTDDSPNYPWIPAGCFWIVILPGRCRISRSSAATRFCSFLVRLAFLPFDFLARASTSRRSCTVRRCQYRSPASRSQTIVARTRPHLIFLAESRALHTHTGISFLGTQTGILLLSGSWS
jgi:hypothetical protein